MFEQRSDEACVQHGQWSVQGDEGSDAAAVARKAKMEGAQQRAVEERRKADERHAALESKHEAKRRLAEEAKERREAVRRVHNSQACCVSN